MFLTESAVSATSALLVNEKAKPSPALCPWDRMQKCGGFAEFAFSFLSCLYCQLTQGHGEPEFNLILNYHANQMLSLHFQRLQ